MNSPSFSRLETWLKIISPLLAVALFFWGVYTYRDTTRRELEKEMREAERAASVQRNEVLQVYLDKQMALYAEVVQLTSIIATSNDIQEVSKAEERFRAMYWGELVLIEGKKVEQAMIAFRSALDENKKQSELARLALNLAHACREELAISWGVDNWK